MLFWWMFVIVGVAAVFIKAWHHEARHQAMLEALARRYYLEAWNQSKKSME